MTENEDDDYISGLYNEFLEALESHNEGDFDREELLEIHDYANDTGDGYVSFMSLSLLLRRFPDDVEAAERLVLYFYLHSEHAAAQRQLDRLPEDSFIRRIMTVALTPAASVEVTGKRLDEIIDDCEPGSLDDEAIIRLIDVVSELDMSDWAYKRYPRLKALAEFPDTLMNELAKLRHTADRKGTLKVLEDFTSEYPFSAEAWLQLAELYSTELNDDEQAENANNFALAIDPKNYEARARQFDFRFRQGAPVDELIGLVDGLLEDYPQNSEELLAQKATVYQYRFMPDEARRTVREALKKHPRSFVLYDILLTLDDGAGLDGELAKAFKSLDDYEYYGWRDRFERHIANREDAAAGAIASFLSKQKWSTHDRYKLQYMECMYRAGSYDEVIAYYRSMEPVEDFRKTLVKLIYFLAMKRAGQIESLKTEMDSYNIQDDVPDGTGNVSGRIEVLGVWFYMNNLRLSLSDPEMPQDNYDPYL